MWRGLYTGAAGMMTQQNRTSVIANNLANVNTTGYKRDRALDAEFHPMLIRRINDDMPIKVTDFKGFSLDRRPPAVGTLGLGAYTSEIAVDHAPGAFMTTGNPLDLAISGNGFFVIDTPQGLRYTRNGNFYRTPTGDLVTSDGQAVLSRQGRPINIPENAIRFCYHCSAETIPSDNLQTSSCQTQFFFTMHIRIRHCPGSNHALFSFRLQCPFQKFRCILLYLNIFKRMRELITLASAVTINASVSTSPVYIHSKVSATAGQNPLCIHKMHLPSSPLL